MPTIDDSINPANTPPGANGYAGYVDGSWPDAAAMARQHPGKPVATFAIRAADYADCLDIENGAASIGQAPGWNTRQVARGLRKPADYISGSRAQALVTFNAANGWPRPSWWLWTAHYTNKPHLCGPPCGLGLTTWADATQWTDNTARNYDVSLTSDAFFAGIGATGPAPTPPIPYPSIEDDMKLFICNKSAFFVNGNGNVVYIGMPPGLAALEAQYGGSVQIDAATLKTMAWNNTTAQNAELTAAGV